MSSSDSSVGKQRFNIIPTIAAKLIPDIVTAKSPLTIDIVAPPNPKTSIADATITFFVLLKSTWFCIKTFNPLTDINPYRSKDTPPKTAVGIVDISAVNLVKKPNIIAIIAANPIT